MKLFESIVEFILHVIKNAILMVVLTAVLLFVLLIFTIFMPDEVQTAFQIIGALIGIVGK